jgi:hypothetical protein
VAHRAASLFRPTVRCYHDSDSTTVPLEQAMTELVDLLGERNFDLYESRDGIVRKL